MYLNYSKQDDSKFECIAGVTHPCSAYVHFVAKQEIHLPKQELIDINFGLSFELDNWKATMIIALRPTLANQGVILPGGAIIVPYRYREPFQIKLISFIQDVVIKPDEVVLEGITYDLVADPFGVILRKNLNPLGTKLRYDPDSPGLEREDINIEYALMQWRKGIKDPDMMQLYPEGHEIYKGIPFGVELPRDHYSDEHP